MNTLTFKIKNLTQEDKEFITNLQKDYSISFRKMYNNMELMEDNSFLDSLRIKPKKHIEYLQTEVKSFYEKQVKNKEKLINNIEELEAEPKLKLSKFRHLQNLKKSVEKNIVFGGKKNLKNLTKNNITKQQWQNSRLWKLIFYGAKAEFGNRYFDLKDIINGNITFKYNKRKIKFNISIQKHKKEIKILNELIIQKEIPVTISFDTDIINITIDETKIYGTYHNIKDYYKKIKHVKDKDVRKNLIHGEYKRHENKLKVGKKDRYLGIDLNPDGIGYSILTPKEKIIHKGYIHIGDIEDANKRKYETSIMIKELFKLIKHFKCHSIVVEELNIDPKDYGNKISNRKINNLWNREFIDQIITRRCNQTGTIRIDINPVYSSFIGNIKYDCYDPVASSIEICRRGINKYSKGGFYPEFNITNFVNDWRYDEIKEYSTWKELYSHFITSKWSYRRELKEFNFVENNISSGKSKLKHYTFE